MDEKNLNDIWHLLGQMDAKLDRVVSDSESQDKRITKLEQRQWFQGGVIAAVSGLVSVAGALFFNRG